MLINEIASKYQTPMYIYDKQEIIKNIELLNTIKRNKNIKINYATKANNNQEILKLINSYNMKVDATGIGEVYLNKKAGINKDNIYVVGNNFDLNELKLLLNEDVVISIDSIDQLKSLISINPNFKKLMLRINPSIGAGGNESIITGGYNHKFGIDINDLDYALQLISETNIKLIGINQHIGSLNLDYNEFISAIKEMLTIVNKFKLHNLDIINFGGGFGYSYEDKNIVFDFNSFSEELHIILDEFLEVYNNKNVSFEFEPGRFVVASSGILVGEVTSIKKRKDKTFIGTNLGFNNMIRPTLYNSYHEISFITENTLKGNLSVVGNLCESGDYLCRDRELIIPNIHDLIIVKDTGAYGFSMASNYNARLKPIELLIDDNEIKVIRERQSIEDLY